MDDPVEACASVLVAAGAAPAAARPVAAALVARYREPRRRYHTLDHVGAVLAVVDDLVRAGEPVADLAVVRVAAWYHDAIVTASGRGDEERSAALAAEDLAALAVEPTTTARVVSLVRATATHEAADDDARLLVDADLAVLGSDPGHYDSYVAAVRAEYADVAEAAFRTGRAAVLRRLLHRPTIYATATLRRRAEARARENLRSELAVLEGAGRAPFPAVVRAVVAATAPGDVVTYGEVAAEAGHPGAARAVGGVLRRSEGLPWWRVVTASGRLAPGKEERQAERLRAEGVVVEGGRVRRGA